MKAIVIYYSVTGNSKCIAEVIAATLQADVLRLPHRGIPSVCGVYDLMVIGAPVWAFGLPAPVSRFLKTVPFDHKRVALYCCYSVYKGRIFTQLKDLLRHANIVGERSFREPLHFRSKQQAEDARTWAVELRRTV